MSIDRHIWIDVNEEDLISCTHWFQNQFQLRDWHVRVDTSITPPDEFGDVDVRRSRALVKIFKFDLEAIIWLPLDRLKEDNDNPYESLIHELCHIKNTRCEFDDEEDEILVRIETPLFYMLYCYVKQIKRAKKYE